MKNTPTNLSNLKSNVDKLDVDKLAHVSVGLSKVRDVVKNDVVNKDVYNAKIKNIEDKIPDITNLATDATLNDKINEVKKKIPIITNVATTTALNAKINEVKNTITNITNLGTTAALTAVENIIPNFSNLVKKTDHNTKISETENKSTTDHDHDKYITTQEFNKLTSRNFTARLKQTNLASKSDIANFIRKANLNKNELNELSKEFKAISPKILTRFDRQI